LVVERIVIFGATGDLTARYLIPALAKLYDEGKLPPNIKITAVDMKEWKDNGGGFRAFVVDSLRSHAPISPPTRASVWPTTSSSTVPPTSRTRRA
jgi:glucose-6-phosphate 1-dehydrogenase